MNDAQDQWFRCLVNYLAQCEGRDHAMTLDELTTQAGIPNRRTTEQLIEERLQEFPFVLVAGSEGYWIPTDAADLNRYLHNLHSRHRRMQVREATVRRKARAAGWIADGDRFVNPPARQLEIWN